MPKFLILPFISVILILNLQLAVTISAQGIISCLELRITGRLLCSDSTNNCEDGYVPPFTCQEEADRTGACPIITNCILLGTTPTLGPTATPTPIGGVCGGQGQKCCGTIPPLTCNPGLTTSDPYVPPSCFCNSPTPTPTRATITTSPPPGGAGMACKNGKPGLETAIGCVPTEPTEFIKAVSQLATGAGGGIALLLMIAGVFRMMTSAGNPDAVKAGSEQFTSALIGLLFIIFAVLLLKVIGVDILDIPGFA